MFNGGGPRDAIKITAVADEADVLQHELMDAPPRLRAPALQNLRGMKSHKLLLVPNGGTCRSGLFCISDRMFCAAWV